MHAPFTVVLRGPLVLFGRSCCADPSVAGGGSFVAPRGQMGVRCPSPGPFSVRAAAYRHVTVELGGPPAGSDRFRSVVPRGEFSPHQHARDEAVVLALAAFLP